MTAATKSLRDVLQPEIDKRLEEYEGNHLLNDEERATVRVILSSIILSERIHKQEKKFKLLQIINLN